MSQKVEENCARANIGCTKSLMHHPPVSITDNQVDTLPKNTQEPYNFGGIEAGNTSKG